MNGTPIVDVCIVSYRADRDLLQDTIVRAACQPFIRTIRVHVNDEPSLIPWLKDLPKKTDSAPVLVTDSRNVGFAAGQNRLLAQSFENGATHALVLNPDLMLEPVAAKHLLETSQRMLDLHLISGVLELRDRGQSRQSLAGDLLRERRVDTAGIVWTPTSRHLDRFQNAILTDLGLHDLEVVPGLSGALILVPSAAWHRITLTTGEFFDADFFAYREDAELGVRAQTLGVASCISKTVVGTHYRGSPGTARANPVTNRWGVRNRFLIRYKWGLLGRPGKFWRSLLRDLIAQAWVYTGERSSRSGLKEARALRPNMQRKKQSLTDALRRPNFDMTGFSWSLRARIVQQGKLMADSVVTIVAISGADADVALETWQLAVGGGHRVVAVRDIEARPVQAAPVSWTVLETCGQTGEASLLNIGIAYALDNGAAAVVVPPRPVADQDPKRVPRTDPTEVALTLDEGTLRRFGGLDETLSTPLSIAEYRVRLDRNRPPMRVEWGRAGFDDPYGWARDAVRVMRCHHRRHLAAAFREYLVRPARGEALSARDVVSVWGGLLHGLLGDWGRDFSEFTRGRTVDPRSIASPDVAVEHGEAQ